MTYEEIMALKIGDLIIVGSPADTDGQKVAVFAGFEFHQSRKIIARGREILNPATNCRYLQYCELFSLSMRVPMSAPMYPKGLMPESIYLGYDCPEFPDEGEKDAFEASFIRKPKPADLHRAAYSAHKAEIELHERFMTLETAAKALEEKMKTL